jgi:hypothetical protein
MVIGIAEIRTESFAAIHGPELSPYIQSIDFLDATPAGKHLASSAVSCQDKNIDFLKTFARK